MMENSIRTVAFRLLDRRQHLTSHSKAMWLYYLLGSGYVIDKYHAPRVISREEATQLVEDYNASNAKYSH